MLRALRRALLRLTGLPSREKVLALRDALEHAGAAHAQDLARRLDRVEHRTDRVIQKTDHVERSVRDLEGSLRKGALRKIDGNVETLLRQAFVPVELLAPPQQLVERRFRALSQHEEDGISIALLARVGAPTRRFVEIGAGTNGGNSGFLARDCGWSGLMLEADPARARALRAQFGPQVTVVDARVTRENVNDLVTRHGFGGEVDLVSIDIDGNDYWVWEALDACRPRLVIIEFNAAFGASSAVTIPYDPMFDYGGHAVAGGHYYGASLRALANLGMRKGYRLVLTEPSGVNAFFVRDVLAGDLPALDPATASVPGERADVRQELAAAGLPVVEIA